MSVAIIIPARFASSRLPGKPLLRETGKYLIQHVYERACAAGCGAEVIVATDDERILNAVRSFGGRAEMTRADHQTGTDRVAEVAANLKADLIVNVQGDEPLIDPGAIDQLVALLERDRGAVMATLAVPIRDRDTYLSPNVVKVVCDGRGRALYFSRSPIPMVRDGEPDFSTQPPQFFQHLGIYAYRRHFLIELAKTKPHPLEECEKLEQLRVLAHGAAIQVGTVNHAHRGIDTPADYAGFVQLIGETAVRRAA
jgi:3-deoxy-manno-octulosonate cytidylyltransferase (CMP-KDO synthetase)